MRTHSHQVFVARVKAVSPGRKTRYGLGDSADIEVTMPIKGSANLKTLDTTFCQNFPLKAGDTRVFFVDANGVIVGCSDYRYFTTDAELISVLRRGSM
jgi:hypothetical protein